ncbi:MAG TPA: hypothetical protein V6D17_10405, partial [Candidatus Obscuribacterales bacterium]
EELRRNGRAGSASFGEREFWVATERQKAFKTIFAESEFDHDLPIIEEAVRTHEEVMDMMLRGWLIHLGPVTTEMLAELLHLQSHLLTAALTRLESSGMIMRGQFSGEESEWCDRRLLSRIHRLTLESLRQKIQPVTQNEYMRWLTRWQHLAPGTQVSGERGLLEVLRQLQGFEMPANAWERQVLARRVRDYDPGKLDRLCLTGAIGWGRLSPHPATLAMPKAEEAPQGVDLNAISMAQSSGAGERRDLFAVDGGRRVTPTSVSPITFFVREDSDWMGQQRHFSLDMEMRSLTSNARAVRQYLQDRGASFFTDIVRATNLLKSEVESALWELVAAGLVTADGFDNLRSLIDPKRRSGQAAAQRPRHAAGRWALLSPELVHDRERCMESFCWMLLRRYGVVFRELLSRETVVPRWRELLPAFRRLEDRGEIRGGRFVLGFSGEQFALPHAVESLRAIRDDAAKGEMIQISSVDPLNLSGAVGSGERIAAVSGRMVTLIDGIARAHEGAMAQGRLRAP